MKLKLFILLGGLLFLNLLSCSDTDANQEQMEASDSTTPPTATKGRQGELKGNTIYGKASVTLEKGAFYSDAFIKELSESSAAKEFYLSQDGVMTIDEDIQVRFPQFMALKDWYRFRAKKDAFMYSLEVQRQDFTTLVFRYVVFEGANRLLNVSKIVELNTHFFLGDESDIDDQTGDSYLASEYSTDDGSCQYSLRIGGEVGELKAKLIRRCQDESESISLEDAPTLRQSPR